MGQDDNVFRLDFPENNKKSTHFLNPLKLTEARKVTRITQSELARQIGVSRQAVSAYELGDRYPEYEIMKKISESLGQPIGFFTKPASPTFGPHSANFFRKMGPSNKLKNEACGVLAQWFSSSTYAFEAVANFPVVDIPQFEPKNAESNSYSSDELEEYAEAVRKHFGLGLGPISNILRLLEVKGVIICRFELPGEKIEAFSFWSGDKPFIFMASDKKSAVRARFDLAHELAHLCLHKWVGKEEIEDSVRLKQIEDEANYFAGAFLLPRKSFPNEVYSPRAESFIDLKSRWKVSIAAMTYRCKNLGIFDERQITNMNKQISYKRWRTVEPLDTGIRAIKFEQPLLLKKIAKLVIDSGQFELEELKEILALSDSTLEKLIGIPFNSIQRTKDNFIPTLKD